MGKYRRSNRIAARMGRLAAPYVSAAAKAASYAGYKYVKKYGGRGARSRTKTRTKRQGSGIIQQGTSGVSNSYYSMKRAKMYKKVRDILKSSPLKINRRVDTTRVEWDAGSQSNNAFDFMDYNRLSQLYSSIGLSTVGATTASLVMKDASIRLCLTNQSNANCYVCLYDIEYRKDVVSGSDSSTPLSSWVNGLAVVPTGTGSEVSSTGTFDVGTTPFQSPDFCRKYKVVRVTKVYLELGKSHIHHVFIKRPRMLNGRMFDNSGAQTLGYGGISHSLLMVCRGMPVNDATTDTNIAFGSGALDVITEEKISWNYDSDNTPQYFFDDNQEAISSEKFMNEQEGVADTYEEA